MAKITKFSHYLALEIKNAGFKNPSRFAIAANISIATISRVNQKQMPDVFTLRKMAAVLGKPLEELMVAAGYLKEEEMAG
ncbi:MAG: helix-turn-helix transcriptional regulator [Veillonellales bacterium]